MLYRSCCCIVLHRVRDTIRYYTIPYHTMFIPNHAITRHRVYDYHTTFSYRAGASEGRRDERRNGGNEGAGVPGGNVSGAGRGRRRAAPAGLGSPKRRGSQLAYGQARRTLAISPSPPPPPRLLLASLPPPSYSVCQLVDGSVSGRTLLSTWYCCSSGSFCFVVSCVTTFSLLCLIVALV